VKLSGGLAAFLAGHFFIAQVLLGLLMGERHGNQLNRFG
jgi:hypothetical protein